MDMGQKIHHLRTQKGLTLEELGNMVGVRKSTVRKWENGIIANMKRDKILKVSEALDTSPAYLMGWNESELPQSYSTSSHAASIVCENVLPYNSLPDGELADNILSAESKDVRIHADFCLKAAGDSMINARIHDGDLVFIHKQDWVENGEIAAIVRNGQTCAELKRFYYYKDKSLLILRAENSAFEDYIFTKDELEQLRILGKAVAFQSQL